MAEAARKHGVQNKVGRDVWHKRRGGHCCLSVAELLVRTTKKLYNIKVKQAGSGTKSAR